MNEFNIGGLRTREEIENKIAELELKSMYGYDGISRVAESINTLRDS